MDNQQSLPQLLFPIVSESFCPQGTISEIFNQFTDQYLNAGAVNIPGLGNVTPEQIAAINAQLVVQQNEINALKKAYRSGNQAISTGDNTNAITFTPAMPSALYDVGVQFIDTGGVATAAFTWAVVSGTQTAGGISIRTIDIPASVASFNWWVRER